MLLDAKSASGESEKNLAAPTPDLLELLLRFEKVRCSGPKRLEKIERGGSFCWLRFETYQTATGFLLGVQLGTCGPIIPVVVVLVVIGNTPVPRLRRHWNATNSVRPFATTTLKLQLLA